MSEVETEFLFEARVKLDPSPLEVGAGPEGYRTVYVVKGGRFEGKRLLFFGKEGLTSCACQNFWRFV